MGLFLDNIWCKMSGQAVLSEVGNKKCEPGSSLRSNIDLGFLLLICHYFTFPSNLFVTCSGGATRIKRCDIMV